jgi:hypothetical protein
MFRIYEVQDEIIARRWRYEVEAPSEDAAMHLVREGEARAVDCSTIDEPFYGESGFAVQPSDADSIVGWERAVTNLNSVKRSI